MVTAALDGRSAALLAVGLVLVARAAWPLRHDLRRLPGRPVDVADAPATNGPTEFRGEVVPADDTLTAPLSGEDCVAFELGAEQRRVDQSPGRSNGFGTPWQTLADQQEAVPFRLEDDTGSILVEPDGALLDVWEGRRQFPGEGGATLEQPVRDRLHSRGVPTGRRPDTGRHVGVERRYSERRLEVGAPVSVYGVVERAPPEGAGPRQVDGIVRAPADVPFLVSDAGRVRTLRYENRRPLAILALGLLLVGYVLRDALPALL